MVIPLHFPCKGRIEFERLPVGFIHKFAYLVDCHFFHRKLGAILLRKLV